MADDFQLSDPEESESAQADLDTVPDGFDEAMYLRAFPDIAGAIANGEFKSALQHYSRHGCREERLKDFRYRNAAFDANTANFPLGDVDVIFISRSGWCLVIGWIDDDVAPLQETRFVVQGEFTGGSRQFARCRRPDAEEVVGAVHGKLLGFWSFFKCEHVPSPQGEARLILLAGHEQKVFQTALRHVSDERLRDVALEYLAAARYFGDPNIETCLQLDSRAGESLIDMGVAISLRLTKGAYVTRFGPKRPSFDGSIVVCLFGKAEFLFLQAALFSSAPEAHSYEFVYVSNSPELAETLLKEAAMASRIYGLSICLVILPGNAGFGAANNVAVSSAQSDRILIANPDVFPRDRDWAKRHSQFVANLPADQTAMFGVPLYYDDGSLMHGGMFFDTDIGLSIRGDKIERCDMVRVEHYAKGAPPTTEAYLKSRAVPAVTGAFISVDRRWFESLAGFSLEYVFGHYEDADLCLKSLTKGKPVWLHNVPFWHLEGKGSTRRAAHDGGSLLNRWHFGNTWCPFILSELHGRSPKWFAPQ